MPKTRPPARHRRLRDHQQGIEKRYGKGNMVAQPDLVEALRVHVLDEGHQVVDAREPGTGFEIP